MCVSFGVVELYTHVHVLCEMVTEEAVLSLNDCRIIVHGIYIHSFVIYKVNCLLVLTSCD